MSQTHDVDVAQTYLGLRLAMILLVGLLFAAVLVEFAATGLSCLQPSLSAYYYTPVRPVFLAAVAAIGACLIVHRGATDAENVLLDVSGFLAFVVAFVPTRIGSDACNTSNVPTAAEISAAVRNNMAALLAVGLVALVLGRWWFARKRYAAATPRPAPSVRWTQALSALSLLGVVVFFVGWPEVFERVGHGVSALALFAAIVAVVLMNAFDSRRKCGSQGYQAWYVAVAVGMVVVAGGIALAGRGGFGHWVFWVESTLITGFAVFWMVQTRELGGGVARDRTSAPPDPSAAEAEPAAR